MGKTILWTFASMGSILVPVQYLNVGLSGSMAFMAVYAVIRSPDSALMQGASRQTILSRTWKHLGAGAAVSGALFALGWLSMERGYPVPGLCTIVAGLPIGAAVASVDCPGSAQRRVAIELGHPHSEERRPLVLEGA